MSESETKRKWRRIHGLQWPWHPQQVTAWSILLYFIIFTFCAIIPNFNSGAQLILTISHALLFLSHLFTHAVAELLDPSDPELRAKSAKRPVPEFDRNKHAHVIENGRCHLCNITISSQRTKHCSACNKCVHVFDHHCKWLNQCIGERNYKWFACSVATAILMALSFIVMALTIIGFYYNDNLSLLHPWENPQNQTINGTEKFTLFFVPVPIEAFMSLTVLSIILAFVAFALLLHLAIFHVYINHVGITTYEYVRAHRLMMEPNPSEQIPSSQKSEPPEVAAKCCQIFRTRKGKILPVNAEQVPAEVENTLPNNNQQKRITDEKLPPLFPSPKIVKEVVKEEPNKKPGSAVPKLPKLENGSGSGHHPKPRLAKVQKHLESIDVEDQDKIYVMEVS